ncbi:MAG: hypothetical protein KGJ60_16150 [Verrucomicrobiota bacterium]|nr:hypothetical protein [Verrucomicrobiota bacterium]
MVEAFVTEQGGHLAPVTFDCGGRKLQPLSICPWCNEKPEVRLPPMLRVLRGDFFCMPFGGNTAPFHGEIHPPHGETANRKWTCVNLTRLEGRVTLKLRMKTRCRPASVERRFTLVDGHSAVYLRTAVGGGRGPMCFGHHAMLKFPERPGSGIVTTSPFKYGLVAPRPVERPEDRGYSILKPGARFTRLDGVPMITGETADLSRYPARRGFEDIVILVSGPRRPFAWTAVTFPDQRYVWFGLKNPSVLRQTVIWMSNGGRHYPPWNGRHVNVLGWEEVTAYFHYGLAESAAPNPLRLRGEATTVELDPARPLVVNYVMGVAGIPRRFDVVADIEPADKPGRVVITSKNGSRVVAPLDWTFLTDDDVKG